MNDNDIIGAIPFDDTTESEVVSLQASIAANKRDLEIFKGVALDSLNIPQQQESQNFGGHYSNRVQRTLFQVANLFDIYNDDKLIEITPHMLAVLRESETVLTTLPPDRTLLASLRRLTYLLGLPVVAKTSKEMAKLFWQNYVIHWADIDSFERPVTEGTWSEEELLLAEKVWYEHQLDLYKGVISDIQHSSCNTEKKPVGEVLDSIIKEIKTKK